MAQAQATVTKTQAAEIQKIQARLEEIPKHRKLFSGLSVHNSNPPALASGC